MQTEEFLLSWPNFDIQVKTIKPQKPASKTLFFLHDSLGCITLWRDFPEKVVKATGYNAIIYDRRGYGKSTKYPEDYQRHNDYMEDEADFLIDLADRLEVSNFSIFGHSDGGTIALIAAAKYADRVQEIVIEGPHLYVEDITRQGVADAKIAYEQTDLKERLRKYHGDCTEGLVKAWTGIWLSEPFQKWNITPQLENIECPILCLQGENDEFGTAQQVRDIKKHTHGPCVVIMIPEIGHTPHKEHPEVVLEVAAKFLSES